MNKKEIFIQTSAAAGDVSRLRYVLSDQKYFLLKYSDTDADNELEEFLRMLSADYPSTINEETGEVNIYADPNIRQDIINLWVNQGSFGSPLSSIYENTFFIELNSVDFNEVILDLVAPVEITFNPSKLDAFRKIYKIEYLFETGTETQMFFYSNSSTSNLTLPYSAEKGDPRNYPKKSIYSLSDDFYTTVYTRIIYYTYEQIEPNEILYTINLKASDLDGQFGYFNEVHLIDSKMFDFDDKILYLFESYNPQYVLPVVVKWEENQNSNIIKKEKSKRIIIKPYRVLASFEDENIEKQPIKSINFSENVSYNIDNGYTQQYNIITQDEGYYIMTSNGKRLRIGDHYNSNINKTQPGVYDNWILSDSFWNDTKIWVDDRSWED